MASAKIIYPNTVVDMITSLVVYGESHFAEGEVDAIRERVNNLQPHIILHELSDEERAYYKKSLPEAKLLPLETVKINKKDSLAKQFKYREDSMIANIKKIYDSGKYGKIAVVVGDTHLRTIATKELGVPTLTKYLTSLDNVSIFRSPNREID
jgi:hypothetical protein